MIITTNRKCRDNWNQLKHKVHGFKFSFAHREGITLYSLDEKLTNIVENYRQSYASITAEELIECIGEEAFKSLIENTWNPEYYHSGTYYSSWASTQGLSELIEAFIWGSTPQGFDYWKGLKGKLRILDAGRRSEGQGIFQ